MKRLISTVLLIFIFAALLPIAGTATEILEVRSVYDDYGDKMALDGSAGLVTKSSLYLTFDSDVEIDSTSLGDCTIEVISKGGDEYNATPVLSVKDGSPNKVRVQYGSIVPDVKYRLTVAGGIKSTEGDVMENDFIFEFYGRNPGYVLSYALGETYRSVNGDDCIDPQSSTLNSDGSVTIPAGGSVTFGFYSPYAMRGITLLYSSASGEITVEMEDEDNETDEYVLSGFDNSGEHYLMFYKYKGLKKQYYVYNTNVNTGYYREYVAHRGEWKVTVSSTDEVTINEIRFEREKTPKVMVSTVEPDVSEETAATYSTVMMHEGAPVIVVNGGKRYVDYDDTSKRPYEYNGRLYLPINTLAKALGYYHEDYPEKGYALMRSDTHDVILRGGSCYIVEGVAEEQPLDEEVIIYRDGRTYAAVRYFAELIGDTVGYSDGLVVIDNKYTVEDIMEQGSLRDYAENIFAAYEAEKTTGRTIYVDQNSQAENSDGSEDSPFKTIGEAAKIAEAGDTVIVRDGIYRETLAPTNSGTVNAPITYKAEGENVVISANEKLENWSIDESLSDDGKNVYKTNMDWNLGATRNQLFINDKMLNEARYPNGPEVLFDTDKLDNAWAVRGDLWRPVGEENENVVKSSTLLWQTETDYWKGGYFVGHFGYDYSVMTAKIIGSSEGELTLGDEKSEMWYTNEGSFNFGYIVGNMNCLDAPGEWIHEWDEDTKEGTMYLIFPDDAVPNQTVVEAKARQLVIDLNDKSYINVVGFKTIGGSIRTNENSNLNVLNGLDMKYITHYIHQSHPYKGEIEFPFDAKKKDGSPEKGESGVYLSGSDNHFVNCNIDHTAGAGVFISGLYAYVENNIIHDSYNSNYVSGIQIMTRGYETKDKARGGHSIYNNTVYNAGRSCLNIGTQDGTTQSAFLPSDIAYNDFHDGMLTTLDTSITYENSVQMGIDGYMTNLHHNYVYITVGGRDKNPWSFSIYHDGHSHGVDTFKNKIFYTQADSPFDKKTVFLQPAKHAPAYSRVWDNTMNLISGGVNALDEEYFTEGKMFYAGAMRDTETMQAIDYTKNYDRFFSENRFTVENVVKSENASSKVVYDEECGYADFAESGEYVWFDGVEFPEDATTIALMMRGDSHYTQDGIEVIVGESMETGTSYNASVEIDGYDKSAPERITIEIDPTSGTQNVWVKATDYKSAQIGGIYVYKEETAETAVDPMADYLAYKWGGEFDAADSKADNNFPFRAAYVNPPDYEHKGITYTLPDTYAAYKGVSLPSSANKIKVSYSTADGLYGQTIEVYSGKRDEGGKKLASFETRYTGGVFNFTEEELNLTTQLDAGEYDIYFYFGGEAGERKTCNLEWFAFSE